MFSSNKQSFDGFEDIAEKRNLFSRNHKYWKISWVL